MVSVHKHYDLIIKWASDPTQEVWCLSGTPKHWHLLTYVHWHPDLEYYVGSTPPLLPLLE